jgi:hypothetical protein
MSAAHASRRRLRRACVTAAYALFAVTRNYVVQV